MRKRTAVLFVFFLYLTCPYSSVWAQEGVYTVISPTPGAPYVAGQKLPLVYQVSANATSAILRLSISLENLKNVTDNVVMVDDADISQGYSQQKVLGDGKTVYEHQTNYDIPKDKAPGEYNVVYTNVITQHKTTVPVRISAASMSDKTSSSDQKPGGKSSIFSGAQTIHGSQFIISGVSMFITLLVLVGLL